MQRFSFALPGCLLAGLTLFCPAPARSQTESAAPAATERTFHPIAGFDPTVMDTTADPCGDFYQYACGNFAKQYPIPGDLPEFDQFSNLYEFNTQALRGIVEKVAAAHAAAGTNEQKIGDGYQACLDTAAIEKKGIAPLNPELERIAALNSKQELPALIAHLNLVGVNVFFGYGSQQDFKDASREIAFIDQGGLGLPEKDYYLKDDGNRPEVRKQYVEHLTKMLGLLGDSPEKAGSEAQQIMAFETALAKVSTGVVERRNPENIYHMMPVATLAASVPLLAIPHYIELAGSPAVTELNVASPEFFKGLNQAIEQTNLETLKAYMRVHLADAVAAQLPHAFDEENFDFFSRKLSGTPSQQARWKRCVNGVDGALGEALGKLYVEQYFPPESKAKTLQMVEDIEGAMDKDLDQLTWMSAETKVKAKEKLHNMANKIGYPDKWRDYSKLTIEPGDALGNLLRASQFENAYELNKIGKPVNRNEWSMTPPTVNAYYDPSMNDINFPAGILLPGFYDTKASEATNYGHIGAVIGHELTHGFDDEGAKFDAKGNLHDWWTPEDKKQFEAKTDCLVNEYGEFTAVDDIKVNGKLTLGENTADNGGARLALMAMLARAAVSGSQPEVSPVGKSYTQEQQFFLGYAQNWCTNQRPELLKMLANVDPHSPDFLRVRGVLVNMPEFAHAFSCKAGQPMAPVNHCRVW
jgi:putative endopeptidase